MKKYKAGKIFQVVLSTKNTLFGADGSKFSVSYAPVNDLTSVTEVGGVTEAVESITTPYTATTVGAAMRGDRSIELDDATSVANGDTLQIGTQYAYVRKVAGNTVYLHTPLREAAAEGETVTQVGNIGDYVTDDISIADEGEYLIRIESPEFGVFADDRVEIVAVDEDAPQSDPNEPVDVIAVAY